MSYPLLVVIVQGVCVLFCATVFFRQRGTLEALRQAKSITLCGLMVAVSVILSVISPQLTRSMRLNLDIFATPLIGCLLGPIAGGIVGGLSDIVQYLMNPRGAYLFALTLNSIVAGCIWGMFLYGKKITFWRVLMARATVSVIVNMGLQSFALYSFMRETPLQIWLYPRIFYSLIALPIETLLICLLLKRIKK